MVIKELNEDHYQDAIRLSEYAFQYRVPEADIKDRLEKIKKHKILGVYEGEELAAKLHLIPLSIMMNEHEWKMGGIAGVATYPEYRRNGYVKQMITETLKLMQEHGHIVSFLHPFDIAFYRKYGWEILNDQKKITIEKLNLKPLEAQGGNIKRFSKKSHHEDIEKTYQQYSRRFTGMLNRDADWWKNHVYSDESHVAVYYTTEQVAKGYLIYEVKNRKMVIEEIITLDHESRLGLWNFICQHDSMLDSVTITMQGHDHFAYILGQPNVKTEVKPYFMARIVDVEACLREFRFNEGTESLFLHLEDLFAPWNTATYFLKDGEVKVFKEKSGSQCVQPPQKGIRLNINSLSAIVFGYKRPIELYELGYLKGGLKEIELFEAMVPNIQSAFLDFF